MLIGLRAAALAFALVSGMAGRAVAETPPQDLLAPVVPQVKAVVRKAQPRASFALGPEMLIGQFHAANTLIHPHDQAGHELPSYLELGPHRGGFLLQISVTNTPTTTHTQVTPTTRERPWTTVTSFYPVSDGRTLVMTWEAAPGAPHGLGLKVGQVLSSYVAQLN